MFKVVCRGYIRINAKLKASILCFGCFAFLFYANCHLIIFVCIAKHYLVFYSQLWMPSCWSRFFRFTSFVTLLIAKINAKFNSIKLVYNWLSNLAVEPIFDREPSRSYTYLQPPFHFTISCSVWKLCQFPSCAAK